MHFSFVFLLFSPSEAACDLAVPSGSQAAVGRPKRTVTVRKRKMCYLAKVGDIFSERADRFFERSKAEIESDIKDMNHSTRFWLGAKFCRLNEKDFTLASAMKRSFSVQKICDFVGISRSTIKNFLRTLKKDVSLKDVMISKGYLSPVEFQPQRHENFFRKYASNYENLKVGGYFKSRN